MDWSAGAVSLLTEQRPGRATAASPGGVSSFGISGTNAHMILEQAPVSDPVAPAVSVGVDGRDGDLGVAVLPWVLSAKSEEALQAQAQRLREHLLQRPGLAMVDVASTLALHRPHFERRATVCAGDRDGLLLGLGALRDGHGAQGVIQGMAEHEGKVAFAFPGQGCQWVGMGLELLERSPVFATKMRCCSEALARYVDWSLEDALRGSKGAPSLERVDVLQPALFAVMVSLAELWRSYGVEPDMLLAIPRARSRLPLWQGRFR